MAPKQNQKFIGNKDIVNQVNDASTKKYIYNVNLHINLNYLGQTKNIYASSASKVEDTSKDTSKNDPNKAEETKNDPTQDLNHQNQSHFGGKTSHPDQGAKQGNFTNKNQQSSNEANFSDMSPGKFTMSNQEDGNIRLGKRKPDLNNQICRNQFDSQPTEENQAQKRRGYIDEPPQQRHQYGGKYTTIKTQMPPNNSQEVLMQLGHSCPRINVQIPGSYNERTYATFGRKNDSQISFSQGLEQIQYQDEGNQEQDINASIIQQDQNIPIITYKKIIIAEAQSLLENNTEIYESIKENYKNLCDYLKIQGEKEMEHSQQPSDQSQIFDQLEGTLNQQETMKNILLNGMASYINWFQLLNQQTSDARAQSNINNQTEKKN